MPYITLGASAKPWRCRVVGRSGEDWLVVIDEKPTVDGKTRCVSRIYITPELAVLNATTTDTDTEE